MKKSRLYLIPLVSLIVGVGVYAETPVTEASKETAPQAVLPDVPGDAMTLPKAIALALEGNPGLAAFSWDIRAGDAKVFQAGRWPNPELSVEIEGIRFTDGPSRTMRSRSLPGASEPGTVTPVAGWEMEKEQGSRSGFGDSEVTISIAQAIELGGKRAKRVAVAKHAKQSVLWDYEAARADVAAETGKAFIAVLSAQEKLALEEELLHLAAEVLRVFRLRAEAGEVTPLESSKAELALARTRVVRDQAKRELHAARSRLAAAWGACEATFTEALGSFEETLPLQDFERLTALIGQNPEVARWAAELALRDSELALKRAQRIPDLTLEAGFRSTGLSDGKARQYGSASDGSFGFSRSESSFDADRENSLVIGFSLPLPLFDRNRGNIAAAEFMVSKTADERRAAEVAVHAALADAYETAASALIETDALRNEVLPKATQVFAKTQRGYRAGKLNYLDVLDAQGTLFDARADWLDALAQFHSAVVDIERLTGQSIDKLDTNENTISGEVTHAK